MRIKIKTILWIQRENLKIWIEKKKLQIKIHKKIWLI